IKRRPLPLYPLFPYTTLFRSLSGRKPVPPQAINRTALLETGGALADQSEPEAADEDSKSSVSSFRFRLIGQGATGFEKGSSVDRSEEHTSELQSRGHVVCRLL